MVCRHKPSADVLANEPETVANQTIGMLRGATHEIFSNGACFAFGQIVAQHFDVFIMTGFCCLSPYVRNGGGVARLAF